MGRKNRRRQKNTEQAIQALRKELLQNRGEYHWCAYCGRKLYPGQWHWMYDEFGQRVSKCNDARSCYERMGEDNRKSLKRAFKRFGARGGM